MGNITRSNSQSSSYFRTSVILYRACATNTYSIKSTSPQSMFQQSIFHQKHVTTTHVSTKHIPSKAHHLKACLNKAYSIKSTSPQSMSQRSICQHKRVSTKHASKKASPIALCSGKVQRAAKMRGCWRSGSPGQRRRTSPLWKSTKRQLRATKKRVVQKEGSGCQPKLHHFMIPCGCPGCYIWSCNKSAKVNCGGLWLWAMINETIVILLGLSGLSH